MEDLEEQYVTVLDDFQHTVENKIRNHMDEAGFPQMPAGVDAESLSDYLFDYQAALDSEGTERSRYTVAGILLCLPILVMSAFPDSSLPFLVYRILMKALVRRRIRRAGRDYPEEKAYIDRVLAFK